MKIILILLSLLSFVCFSNCKKQINNTAIKVNQELDTLNKQSVANHHHHKKHQEKEKLKTFKIDINNDNILDIIKFNLENFILEFYISTNNKEVLVSKSYFLTSLKDDFENHIPIEDIYIEAENIIISMELTGLARYYEDLEIKLMGEKILLIKSTTNGINKTDFDAHKKECTYTFNNLDISKLKYVDYLGKSIEKECKDNFMLNHTFGEVFNYIKENKNIDSPVLERLSHYIKSYPINKQNVSRYNDIGY